MSALLLKSALVIVLVLTVFPKEPDERDVANNTVKYEARGECSESCTDFHRSCPAIKDPGYADKFTQAGVVDYLSKKELPAPIDCSNPVYHVWCPHTCGICVSCEQSDFDELKTELQDLKDELAAPAAVTTTTPAPLEDLEPIEVIAAFAVKCVGESFEWWGIELAVDKNPHSIYQSEDSVSPWAKFYIPQSRVTTVRVLNRVDCCGERMNGVSVWVCKAEPEMCVKCGRFYGIGAGQWGTVQCGGNQGIQGHYIEISVQASKLQFAEVEIIGAAEKLVGKLRIRGATSTLDRHPHIVSHSLDNDDTTFYHSHFNNGWAAYEVAQSDITLVKVMNRHDCCQERLMGVTVYVCSDESTESCKECGKYNDYVGRKQWAVMPCDNGDGINGRYVKVASAANQVLQITEVEIYANVPHRVLSSPLQHPDRIVPIASFASKCLDNKPYYWGLHRAQDGNANTLYHSDTASRPFARFYFPKSLVTSVKIQNRAECCGGRMTGESVWICGSNFCVKCGQFGKVGNGQWGVLNCRDNRGIEGSYVEVTVPAAKLQIAEINILGKARERVRETKILSASSSEILQYSRRGSRSYDNNADTFFHSRYTPGWIEYEVVQSYITLIRLQNRVDCCGEQLMGAKVFVCPGGYGNICRLCGTFFDPVGNGEWGAMPCGDGNGILGRFVKVVSVLGHVLQIAEIKIFSNAK